MHPFAMETAAILVHSLNRFSLCTKMTAVVVAKLLLCCDIISKRSIEPVHHACQPLQSALSLCLVIILVAVGPPGPVSNLRVTSSTATTLTITWTVTGSIDRFEVKYNYTVNRCLETGGPVLVTVSDGSMRSSTLRDLNEDSSYTITVRAINTAGSMMGTTMADTQTSGKAAELRCSSLLKSKREIACDINLWHPWH